MSRLEYSPFIHMKNMGKIAILVLCLFLGFVFLDLVVGAFLPAGLETKSTKRAHALLFADEPTNDLPEQFEITFDGTKAIFHKGDRQYDDLVLLLHNGRSSELMAGAGEYPRFSFAASTNRGEMAISSHLIKSHFPIFQSTKNTNFFWIRLPKLTTPGRTFPIFTVDPRVIDFIKSNSPSVF